MCDYSLEHLASRPAMVGDHPCHNEVQRDVHNRLLRGGRASLAVCIKPGTELAFEREIEGEALLFKRGLGSQVARFRRVNEDRKFVHHDALELPFRKSRPAHTPSSGPTRHGLAVAGGGAGGRTSSYRNRSTHDSITTAFERDPPTYVPVLVLARSRNKEQPRSLSFQVWPARTIA